MARGDVLEPTAPAPASRGRTPRGARSRRRPADWIVLAVAVLAAVVSAVPFVLIVLNSFKSPAESTTTGPLTPPSELYTDGLVAFWERVNFPEKLWNSIIISGSVAVLAVGLSLLNAFALGIGRVRGR